MKLESIQPPGWAAPKGYSNGVLAPAGSRLLCVAGQIAWDAEQRLVGRGDFALQFRTALANVAAVVRAAMRTPVFVAGVGIPDLVAFRADMLEKGVGGIVEAGFFGNDWGVATGTWMRR